MSVGFHTFDADGADRLEDPSRYRYLSREELVAAVAPSADDHVVDLGSGTGFYTDDVAPHVGSVTAVDLQAEMHERYREKGVPDNVRLVTAGADDVPLSDGSVDAVVSTMTYHEFPTASTVAEIARLLGPDGRVVIADWSANGDGEAGPPTDERYDAAHAVDALADAGITARRVDERPETFLVTAARDIRADE